VFWAFVRVQLITIGNLLDLSFVILTWNSRSHIEPCLASIRSAMGSTAMDYEVLVLDNGSQDGTVALLEEAARSDARVKPFYRRANTGTTRSRNALLGVAQGEFICVMDADAYLRPGVCPLLMAYLRSDPGIGVVVPRVEYSDGRWQKSVDGFPTLQDKLRRLFRLRSIEAEEAVRFDGLRTPIPVDYAISAFWLFRRQLLGAVGLLDECIFYAPEDVDFCLRVWQSGLKVVYVPTVSVVHHSQEISRGLRINRAKLRHVAGLLYYFRKHRYWLKRPRFSGQACEGGASRSSIEAADLESTGRR
jgi:GT2 family glycosyltransferase